MRKINRLTGALLAALLSTAVPLSTNGTALVFAEDGETQNAQVIDVTDYGADPNGLKDSQPAVMKAIEAASEVQGDVRIVFPNGTYQLYPDQAYHKEMYLSNTSGIQENAKMRTIGICIEDMENVVVEGNDSRFIFHHKMTPYASINSTNVTFQNFTVDFETPTCIELLAQKRNEAEKSITYHIPESNRYSIEGNRIVWTSEKSPYTGQAYWMQTNNFNYVQMFDSKTGDAWRGNSGPLNNISRIEDLGNSQIKIYYTSMPGMPEGCTWQSRNTLRDQVAAALLYSKDVHLKNIHESYVHGFGMMVQMCENVTLDGVIFDSPEKSGRATSSSADDINISGVKGKIEIKNSRFHNPHDDPINVHGTFLMVKNIDRANKKITVEYQHNETSGFPNYFVGDEIEFSTKGSLVPISEGEVFKVVAADGPDGLGGWTGVGGTNKNQIVLTLDKDIPTAVSVNNTLVENITYTPDVHIHNNVFDASPTRGILCTTRGEVIIENNIFDRMNMAAIFISCDGQSWYESGRATDVTIRSNTFIRSNEQDILIGPTNPTVTVDAPVHHNIKIEDNTFFRDVNHNLLSAKSTDGLTFRNNRVLRTNPFSSLSVSQDELALSAGQTASLSVERSMNSQSGSLFHFNGSKNITIEGNTYDPGFKPQMTFAGGSSASHVTVTNDLASTEAAIVPEDAMPAWVSSDPSVASVDLSGHVTGLNAGTATITSYLISGGRRFTAGTTTVTVSGEAVSNRLSVSISGADKVSKGETAALQAAVLEDGQPADDETVTWSVLDPATMQASSLATIDTDGTLHGNTGGVVLVKAQAGLASACKTVVIEGQSWSLAQGITKKYTAASDGEGAVVLDDGSITMKHLYQGLYQEQANPNVFAAGLPEGFDKDDLMVTIKAVSEGSGDWGCSGLYLMNDADNYISVERKNRGNASESKEKMAAVREASRSATEHYQGGSENAATRLTGTTYWYRLVKSGNTVNAFYSQDGTSFLPVASDLDGAFLSDSMVIAIAAGEAGANSKFTTFSDLQIAKADGSGSVSIDLTRVQSASPVASASLSLEEGTLSLSVEKAGAADSTVTIWESADAQTGPWTPTDLVAANGEPSALLKGKFVRATVYEQNGEAVSTAVSTSAVRIPGGRSLSIVNPTETIKAGNSATFTASGMPEGADVTWSVKDALSGKATSSVTIDETTGELNAISQGLVAVEASCGGETTAVLVRIDEDFYTVSDAGAIAHQANADAMRFGDGSYASRPVGQGIYQGQDPQAINMVSYPLPENLGDTYSITVKATGFVPAGNNVYRETGLYLMKDEDNYFASSRKTRPSGPKMATVREISQVATETFEGKGNETASPNVTSESVWLSLSRQADGSMIGSYSIDGETFTDVQTMAAIDLGDRPKIALAATGGSASEPWITFSDLKVDGQAIEMTKVLDTTVEAPSSVSASLNEAKNGMILSAQLADGLTRAAVWQSAPSEDGPWSVITSMHGDTPAIDETLAGQYVRAVVFAKNGQAMSEAVSSSPILISEVGQVENPAESVVSSEARLKSITLDGQALNPADTNWFVVKEVNDRSTTLDLQTLDADAAMTVTVNKKPQSGSEIALEPGYNLVEIHIEAPDQVTVKDYRVQIFRNGDGDDSLASLKVNGSDVTVSQDDTASVILDKGTNTMAIEALAASAHSKATVYDADGNRLTQAAPLADGKNTFTIKVETETMKAPRIITLTVQAAQDARVLLENVEWTDVTAGEVFDPMDTGFTGSVHRQVFGYQFESSDTASLIEVFLNGSETAEVSGTGSAAWSSVFDQTRDINTLAVKVSAADKSVSKTYSWQLKKQDSFYLSDFTWRSATSGDAPDNPVRADKSCSNNTIRLRSESGTNTEYEKGIGVHCDSNVVIDLTQKSGNFNRFEAMVGVDQNTQSGRPDEYPAIIFKVYGTNAAGEEILLAESGRMMTATPAEKLTADLDGIVSLRLEAKTALDNIWNAHGNWADAKVTSVFEAEEADLDVTIVGQGTVSKPEGTLYEGMHVSLSATPAQGQSFVAWKNASGETISTESTLAVVVGDARFEGLIAEFSGAPEPVILDYALLDQAIAKAEAVIRAESSYQDAKMNALKTALASAKTARTDAQSQDLLDAAARACGDALLKVRRTPARDALNSLT